MWKRLVSLCAVSFFCCSSSFSSVRGIPLGKLSLQFLFGNSSNYRGLYLSVCEKQIKIICTGPKMAGGKNLTACLSQLYEVANKPEKSKAVFIDDTNCGALMNLTSGLVEQTH